MEAEQQVNHTPPRPKVPQGSHGGGAAGYPNLTTPLSPRSLKGYPSHTLHAAAGPRHALTTPQYTPRLVWRRSSRFPNHALSKATPSPKPQHTLYTQALEEQQANHTLTNLILPPSPTTLTLTILTTLTTLTTLTLTTL
eukprot:scaffold74273_cov57-Phaeocystis_antarctica.AAC.1